MARYSTFGLFLRQMIKERGMNFSEFAAAYGFTTTRFRAISRTSLSSLRVGTVERIAGVLGYGLTDFLRRYEEFRGTGYPRPVPSVSGIVTGAGSV